MSDLQLILLRTKWMIRNLNVGNLTESLVVKYIIWTPQDIYQLLNTRNIYSTNQQKMQECKMCHFVWYFQN